MFERQKKTFFIYLLGFAAVDWVEQKMEIGVLYMRRDICPWACVKKVSEAVDRGIGWSSELRCFFGSDISL